MSTIVQEIPQLVVTHLEDLASKFGIPVGRDHLDDLKNCWREKQRLFVDLILEKEMEPLQFMSQFEPRGALLLTYSGSLICVGPMVDGKRNIDYTGIGLRTDNPETLHRVDSGLSHDTQLDEAQSFINNPIQQTSPISQIALAPPDLAPDQQMVLLQETAMLIIKNFIPINAQLIS